MFTMKDFLDEQNSRTRAPDWWIKQRVKEMAAERMWEEEQRKKFLREQSLEATTRIVRRALAPRWYERLIDWFRW